MVKSCPSLNLVFHRSRISFVFMFILSEYIGGLKMKKVVILSHFWVVQLTPEQLKLFCLVAFVMLLKRESFYTFNFVTFDPAQQGLLFLFLKRLFTRFAIAASFVRPSHICTTFKFTLPKVKGRKVLSFSYGSSINFLINHSLTLKLILNPS